jgi:microcin C transport system substrate-binding protein
MMTPAACVLAALAMLFAFVPASANAEPRHGLSVFGELKYGPDFQHFDYVNPDAPKGGRMVTMGTGGATTYDTFNQYIL